MNAPRQGLFASLLVVSFAIHTFLLVIATTHQLNETRTNQGQLMTTQLVTDSLVEMQPPNTVSLALVVSRYATNPSVASIRILDEKNRVLATGGLFKTREGEIFARDAMYHDQKVGSVEITLIKPSIGEILRTQWVAILLSLIVHMLVWGAYRMVARPSRKKYVTRRSHEARLQQELQALTQALEQEKQNATLALANAQPHTEAPNPITTEELMLVDDKTLALNIQFYDPKQLLDTVTTTVSVPYFNLCQLFLNKSAELAIQHYQLKPSDLVTVQAFNASGATITLAADTPHAVECITMMSHIFQLLSEVLYKRYRAEKRFVLQTRCAIATSVEEMQFTAIQAAERLTSHLVAKENALYLSTELLKQLADHYELISLPHPNSVLTRHAFIIKGMDAETAELVQNFRADILKGKHAKAS